MGRVIITFKDNHTESFKCKSEANATKIADKRPNVKEWKFYNDNDYIPKSKKKPVVKKEMSLEQMEALISRL